MVSEYAVERTMKLFIFGAGDKGERIFNHLEQDDVVAFVDSNEDKIGGEFCGKRIISISQYMKDYRDSYIVIAHSDVNQTVQFFERENIENYFLLSDCPAELQEPNSRDNLKHYIEDYLNTRNDYVLYGITLYSILIDRWIYKKYHIHPMMVADKGMKKVQLESLCRNFSELAIIDWEELEKKKISEVDIVISDTSSHLLSQQMATFNYVDLYDCSDRITAYRNHNIEKFKNMYSGARCFIVATGPSLRIEDLNTLKDNKEVTFSVNGIMHAFEQTTWRPTYYVSDDYRVVHSNEAVIDDIECEAKFIGDTYAPFWNREHPKNVYKYHKHYEYYYNRLPKFSEDFAQKSYTGLTVAYTCIQLAVYMGFRIIYLLGTDCNYVKGSNSNYFFSDNSKDFFDHQIDKTVMAYQAAKQYADTHGIKILNATRGGMLEVFERVDFDSLFD